MQTALLLMLLSPLAGAVLNGLVLRTPFAKRAGVLATIAAGISFVMALVLWGHLVETKTPIEMSFPWFSAGDVAVAWGFRFDSLTSVMALFVTGIGTIIHAYSIGYMSEERTPYRYFAYLNLFLFAMITLITGANLPVLFVGWEGVGLCSYLLIGYWYQDTEKANAGMKAFLMNRIGDAGFLIGIFLCIEQFRTVNFAEIATLLKSGSTQFDVTRLNLAAFFLFVGAMGKSAQIPLYTWLPDAMAGPTPVSALIHAATMVTAGIYLVVRMNPLFSMAADASFFVAGIGAATALLAAFIATSQNDIKKVLAYSTVSQLGLIFMALGCGAYVAGIFHVVTHAFFKALLFLGAGSVIHGLHGEQDIRHMGGLRKEMPLTFWTFTVAWIAICGIPPLSGFFSKDMMLFSVLAGPKGVVFWALGSLVSILTAFYMTRLYVLTFFGTYRGHAHAHESPLVMTIPLMILAVGSAFAGLLEVPHSFHVMPEILSHYLDGVLPRPVHSELFLSELAAMAVATVSAVLAIGIAVFVYGSAGIAEKLGKVLQPVRYVFENKFFVDELYHGLFVKPFEWVSGFLSGFFDGRVIDATLLLPSRLARAGGTVLSLVQWGSTQFYMLVMLLGGLVVLWISLKGLVLL